MKKQIVRLRFLSFFIFIISVFLLSLPTARNISWASPEESQDNQKVSDELSSDDKTETINTEPVKTSTSDYNIHIKSGALQISLPLKPLDPKSLDLFESLPIDVQHNFQKNRILFLSSVVKVLNKIKYVPGIGSLVKEKILWIKDRNSQAEPISFKERSNKFVTKFIQALDAKLAEKSPLIADGNEFSVFVAANIAAEGGRGEKGWGGLMDFGISFGFDKNNRAVVFQVFRNLEKYHNSLMPVVTNIGIGPRAGILIRKTEAGNEMAIFDGSSFYPPGAPVFTQGGSHHMILGTGMTVLGFPPPPFDLAITFSNKHTFKSWVYLSFSPITKGFVRLKLGFGEKIIAAILEPIKVLLNRIKSRPPISNSEMATISCSRIY